jgi:hypothetical protein
MEKLTKLTKPKARWNHAEQTGTWKYFAVTSLTMNCRPCFHPSRHEIDRQIVAGVPLRSIARSFGVSLGAVHRHKEHVKEALAAARQSREKDDAKHGSALYERVEKLVSEAEEILAAAKAKNDFRGANGALGAAAKLLDLLGRVSGELQSANAGGIHLSLTSNRVTVNTAPGSDAELAELLAEATDDFDPVVIERFKALSGERSQRVLTDSHNSAILNL